MNLREWHDWKYDNCDIKEEGEQKMAKVKRILKEVLLAGFAMLITFGIYRLVLPLRFMNW